jgi:hypothetical protein
MMEGLLPSNAALSGAPVSPDGCGIHIQKRLRSAGPGASWHRRCARTANGTCPQCRCKADAAALGRSVHLPVSLGSLIMALMKLKLNLSPAAKPAQCWTPAGKTESLFGNACSSRPGSPFALLSNRRRPLRIPTPTLSPRPVLRGNKPYLRALRAAELAAWNANIKFPTF